MITDHVKVEEVITSHVSIIDVVVVEVVHQEQVKINQVMKNQKKRNKKSKLDETIEFKDHYLILQKLIKLNRTSQKQNHLIDESILSKSSFPIFVLKKKK